MDSNPVGRPSKVSPALAKQIALLISEGQPERDAAEACGLDGASFYNYLSRAKAGDPQFAEFARIIEAAKESRRTWRKPAPGQGGPPGSPAQ